jgi:hypothetical protein
MNFQDLLTKMVQLDQPVSEADQVASPLPTDGLDECGMPGMSDMPSGMMGMPKQQDNVNMNVTMSGSGQGGIRDLLNVLKDIQSGGSDDMEDPEIIMKKMSPSDLEPVLSQEEFANEPDEVYSDIDAVTGSGTDLNRSKTMYPNSYRMGDNPMAMESLVDRLSGLYEEIKNR